MSAEDDPLTVGERVSRAWRKFLLAWLQVIFATFMVLSPLLGALSLVDLAFRLGWGAAWAGPLAATAFWLVGWGGFTLVGKLRKAYERFEAEEAKLFDG